MKYVCVMADYCANPLWDEDGVMMEMDEVPISNDLRNTLVLWQDRYDVGCLSDGSEWAGLDEFVKDGLALALLVQEELPDWTVIYFDESRGYRRDVSAIAIIDRIVYCWHQMVESLGPPQKYWHEEFENALKKGEAYVR